MKLRERQNENSLNDKIQNIEFAYNVQSLILILFNSFGHLYYLIKKRLTCSFNNNYCFITIICNNYKKIFKVSSKLQPLHFY